MPDNPEKNLSKNVANDEPANSNRRLFVQGAVAGIVGAAGIASLEAQQQNAPAADLQAPPGLKATPDLRFPLCYQVPVTQGVRVLMDYFSALSRRDARAMADAMHFPFGSYEGTDYAIVKTPEDLISHAPPSMNLTENPERFTDHDSYLKPGSYDVFDGIEVFNSDPISVNMALTYWRYGPDGKRMLRCQGIYWATNNDGKWALQKASTIFTPYDMVGVEYPDAMAAAKRLRIDHDLQFVVRDQLPVSVPPYPTFLDNAAKNTQPAPAHSQTYNRMHMPGGVMTLFKVKGVKSRVAATAPAEENIASPGRATDYLEYRDTFKELGLGPWGWVFGTSRDSKIIHHTADKVHFTACAARYTATGEEINSDVTLSIATCKKGYWRLSGGMGYVMTHDRGNDRA